MASGNLDDRKSGSTSTRVQRGVEWKEHGEYNQVLLFAPTFSATTGTTKPMIRTAVCIARTSISAAGQKAITQAASCGIGWRGANNRIHFKQLQMSLSTSSVTEMTSNDAGPSRAETNASIGGPVYGIFAIDKPSGQTSMSMLDALKPLLASSPIFQVPAGEGDEPSKQRGKTSQRKRKRGWRNVGPNPPKIGQGGTLDPLADGVLVVGIGKGTKELQSYLYCTKEYRTVALLGASTLSYDSDDPILHRRPHSHIDAETIENVLASFRGTGKQMPPLYSAVKIDGKRLLDYAREGKDLPRPIDQRDIEVSKLELVQWQSAEEHNFKPAAKECSEEERVLALRARKLAGLDKDGDAAAKQVGEEANADGEKIVSTIQSDERDIAPAAFTLDMTVSSGTYVRSIVHDVGARAGSAAYVVKLTRTRQGKWVTEDYNCSQQMSDTGSSEGFKQAIPWTVFQDAIDQMRSKKAQDAEPALKKQAIGSSVESSIESSIDSSDGLRASPSHGAAHVAENGGKAHAMAEWERLVLERMDKL